MAKKITFHLDDVEEPDQVEAYTIAGYDQECPGCEELILQGDQIALVDGDWVHAKCPERFTRDKVCDKCFLVHNGECW